MRDVIQGMVQAETEAKRIVAAAKAEAERLVAEAHKQAQGLAQQVLAGTRDEAARIVEAASREAEREKKDRLAKATAEVEKEVRMDESLRRDAVEAVVKAVCGKP
jgi:vacuolar-type H+-ATPase subunit H